MQGTFIGFNTASIKYEDKFLALMLKVKLSNQLCQSYYLQARGAYRPPVSFTTQDGRRITALKR